MPITEGTRVARLCRAQAEQQTVDRLEAAINRSRRRRSIAQRGVLVASTIVLGALLGPTAVDRFDALRAPPASKALRLVGGEQIRKDWTPKRGERWLRFEDGSSVMLSDDAQLSVERNHQDLSMFRLRSGEAEFFVKPGGARQWSVLTTHLVVTVLGTRFKLKADEALSRIYVYKGRVMIEDRASGAAWVLIAGQSARVPQESPKRLVPKVEQVPEAPKKARPSPRRTRKTPSTRPPVARGSPVVQPEVGVRDATETPTNIARQMLDESDEAKAKGDFQRAAQILVALLARADNSEEAPYAAFALGGLQMDHLGQPREAEKNFTIALGSARLPKALKRLARERLEELRDQTSTSKPKRPPREK